MEWKIIVFKVEGVSPILMNNPAETLGKEEAGIIKGGKKKYNDNDEAEIRTYKNKDGELYVPSSWFFGSMLKAATGDKAIVGSSKRALNLLIASAVRPSEDTVPLIDEKGKPITEYKIDKRRVVIQKNGIMRCRPLIENWGCLLPLEIDVETLGVDAVLQTLTKAGNIIGIGDYRPTCKGPFGKFIATLNDDRKKILKRVK